jgi:hypothetical protein
MPEILSCRHRTTIFDPKGMWSLTRMPSPLSDMSSIVPREVCEVPASSSQTTSTRAMMFTRGSDLLSLTLSTSAQNQSRLTSESWRNGHSRLPPRIAANSRNTASPLQMIEMLGFHSPFDLRNSRTTSVGSRCSPSTARFIRRISSTDIFPASAAIASRTSGCFSSVARRTMGTASYGGK